MAKPTIAAAVGLAVAHRQKDRHGPDGGSKPAAKYAAMLAAVQKAVASNQPPEKVRAAVLEARSKHRGT